MFTFKIIFSLLCYLFHPKKYPDKKFWKTYILKLVLLPLLQLIIKQKTFWTLKIETKISQVTIKKNQIMQPKNGLKNIF